MSVNLSPVGGAAAQFFNNDGILLAGGLIETYAAGTTTPLATYTTSIGNIAHSNPIQLNASGRIPGGEVWITNGLSYKFVLKDSTGALIATYDNIDGINSINASNIPFTGFKGQVGTVQDLADNDGSDWIGFEAAGNSVPRSAQDKMRDSVSVKDYGAVGDGVTNDTTAFQNAEAVADFIDLPEGQYLVDIAPVKTYLGPGEILSDFISPVVFTGSGINDAIVSGGFDSAFPFQIQARIFSAATAAVATTGFSAAAGIGTLTFAGGATYPVGSWVQISGVSVTTGSINGNVLVLTSIAGQITFYTSATGSQTVAGTVQSYDRFELSFDNGSTWNQTYASYDPITDTIPSIFYTCNIWASPITMPQTQTRVGPFIGLFIEWGVSRGHTVGNYWSFDIEVNPMKVFTHGPALYLNGQRALTIEANRNITLGKNVFGDENCITVDNIGIGIDALTKLSTGFGNTALGNDALNANTSGRINVAIGPSTLRYNTSGYENIAIGIYSMFDNTSGSINTSVGTDTNRYNTSGNENVAIGTQAIYQNRTGVGNVAVGVSALRGGNSSFGNNDNNQYCVAVGLRAMNLAVNTESNTAIGVEALYRTLGDGNVGVGFDAGSRLTFGNDNIFIGKYAGFNVLQKVDANNAICLGDNTYTTGSNGIAIGSAVTAAANEVVIGNNLHVFVRPTSDGTCDFGAPSSRWKNIYATNGTIITSDQREKQDVADLTEIERHVAIQVKGLIKSFRFKSAVEKKGDEARTHFGVMAQEVKAAFENAGLDPHKYALFCYDEWQDEWVDETIEKTKTVYNKDLPHEEKYFEKTGKKTLIRKGGNRYGIRYEELLAFVLSAL